jgi:hypothetical protein
MYPAIKMYKRQTAYRGGRMDNYPLLNLFWTIFIIFGFVLWFWLVISVFTDNFRRTDHSGWAKAGWTVVIVCLPLLGILLYMIARPKMTEQDKELIEQYQKQQDLLSGHSSAEEIAKLQQLKESGAITAEEFESLKKKALA